MRILIPEAAGGPRLRYDARPWIIMMASSVHHADNAGRNDTLKWSINEVSLMSFIACKQDPGSYQLTSFRMVPLCGQRGEKHISAGRCGKNVSGISIHHAAVWEEQPMRAVAIAGERVHSIVDLSSYPT
jgi:hypothetical protein